MPDPAKRIPIAAAKRIAEAYGQRQVILVTWDGKGTTHVVTYGVSAVDCDQAGVGGNRVREALGWPPEKCTSVPAATARRIRKALQRRGMAKRALAKIVSQGDDLTCASCRKPLPDGEAHTGFDGEDLCETCADLPSSDPSA